MVVTIKIKENTSPRFLLLWLKHTSSEHKSGIPNQQTYIRSLCLLNWFQLLLPHHWQCNKWAVFYQSWKVQTCEFNQVHRRIWLETHAAFLSYDLITRLFSFRVKGAGFITLNVVWSYALMEENILLAVRCDVSGTEPGTWWWHR